MPAVATQGRIPHRFPWNGIFPMESQPRNANVQFSARRKVIWWQTPHMCFIKQNLTFIQEGTTPLLRKTS